MGKCTHGMVGVCVACVIEEAKPAVLAAQLAEARAQGRREGLEQGLAAIRAATPPRSQRNSVTHGMERAAEIVQHMLSLAQPAPRLAQRVGTGLLCEGSGHVLVDGGPTTFGLCRDCAQPAPLLTAPTAAQVDEQVRQVEETTREMMGGKAKCDMCGTVHGPFGCKYARPSAKPCATCGPYHRPGWLPCVDAGLRSNWKRCPDCGTTKPLTGPELAAKGFKPHGRKT
jgi:hypothetical protein